MSIYIPSQKKQSGLLPSFTFSQPNRKDKAIPRNKESIGAIAMRNEIHIHI